MKRQLRSEEMKVSEVAGNVMTELQEADLGNIAGAGAEILGSNGIFCTLTIECDQLNTLLCC